MFTGEMVNEENVCKAGSCVKYIVLNYKNVIL